MQTPAPLGLNTSGLGKILRAVIVCIMTSLIALTSVTELALASGISGTYVDTSANVAIIAQIVQTSDGHLTGHYRETVMQGRKLNDLNASITGASDGRTITFTLKPDEAFAPSLSLSGTIEGNTLRASGGGYGKSITLNLVKASENDFEEKVSDLKARVEINNARFIIDNGLRDIDKVITEMTKLSSTISEHLSNFAPAEERYRQVTVRMKSALLREKQIWGQGAAAVPRTQIAVAIQQASIQTDQLHSSVRSTYQKFDTRSKAISKRVSDMRRLCQTASTNVADDDLLERWQTACKQLVLAEPAYEASLTKEREAFTQIEIIWQQERPKQEAIVQAAFRAQ